VDLSASRIRTVPERVFAWCFRLAAVAFPAELESIKGSCFLGCDALQLIDLSATQLGTLGDFVFFACGVTHVWFPASLRKIGEHCFESTSLKVLDLRACAGVIVAPGMRCEVTELWLPREGFAGAARAFLPGSRVEVLEGDVDAKEVAELRALLGGWGIDKLRVVSRRFPPYQWRGVRQLATLVPLTDPVTLTRAAAVTMTTWRKIPDNQLRFVRSLDLSGLVIEWLPNRAKLGEMVWLQRAVLPATLRELPRLFFERCWRLEVVETDGCTALETIEWGAFLGCRSLAAFGFPPTVRELSNAFIGTSLTVLDLRETAAESAAVGGLPYLEELLLPRRCVLESAFALPSLRRVSFGGSSWFFECHPAEVRFESMTAEATFAPGLVEARLYAEVACELGRETIPYPPP
jgi:hypothetical protein